MYDGDIRLVAFHFLQPPCATVATHMPIVTHSKWQTLLEADFLSYQSSNAGTLLGVSMAFSLVVIRIDFYFIASV